MNVLSQCRKVGKKLSALIRISKFITFAQRSSNMKAFIESQFGYCPLVWMFCGRQTNARINDKHETALRLRAVYKDEVSPFKVLLEKVGHKLLKKHENISCRAIIFKIKNNLSNYTMAQLICKRTTFVKTFNHKFFVTSDKIYKLRVKTLPYTLVFTGNAFFQLSFSVT